MSNMENVDHTHPHTDEPFGEAFRRGPDVAADGGRDSSRRRQTQSDGSERFDGTRTSSERSSDGSRDSGSESRDAPEDAEEQKTDDEEMEDVDHESPNEGANRTFERGTEGRDESV